MVEKSTVRDMTEIIKPIQLLNKVSLKRRELGLRSLEEVKFQPLSVDINSRGVSSNTIRRWELDPSHDAGNAVSRNIVENLSIFSERELETMFGNLVAIQLTHGCNGNCPWCLFGAKQGVEAKFSFSSIADLFKEKRDVLQQNPFLLYWDSDPFDYRDGDKTFLDIFHLYRQYFPRNAQYISTAIPLGGENDFLQFVRYLYSDSTNPDINNSPKIPVRISLSRQNIQRVEEVLFQTVGQLIEDGAQPSKVNDFFEGSLTIVERFDNHVLPIGPLIGKADDIRDTFSTACRDGVVVSPITSEAIMITAATKHEPSGQKAIILYPGSVSSTVPLKVREEHHTRFIYGQASLNGRVASGQIMLPIIKRADGQELRLGDDVEDVVLKLGREIAAMGRLIGNFSRLTGIDKEQHSIVDAMTQFNNASVRAFEERKNHLQTTILQARSLLVSQVQIDEIAKEKVSFYIKVATIHMQKTTFLTEQIENGRSPETVSVLAAIVAEISSHESSDLDELLLALGQLTKQQLDEYGLMTRSRARTFIREIVSTMR